MASVKTKSCSLLSRLEVSGHEIKGIEILEHKESYLTQAKMIADDVLAKECGAW